MQAAFTALIAQLRQDVAALKKANNAVEFIDALAALYAESSASKKSVNQGDELVSSNDTNATEAETDAHTLLQQYAKSTFTGTRLTSAQAAWFVCQSLGFVPDEKATQFRLVRPAFNVVNLQLPRSRRFIMHAKNNTAPHPNIQKASWQHQPLNEPYTLTREQLLRGGILELKMK